MEERLRDELEIRRRQAQKQQEAQMQAAEDAARLDALRKSLRGSEYTIDHQGQVRSPLFEILLNFLLTK